MNNKEKRCKSYCGYACLNGSCPITMYRRHYKTYERRPTCEDCLYYKGCEDCCFENTDMCPKVGDKNE